MNKKQSIGKSIGLLSVLMLISKVIGLIREVAIAGYFGATSSTDAYFVASGFITNVFFGITAALSVVFLPYYIEKKKKSDKNETSKFCSSLITTLSIISIAIVVLLFILAPWVSKVIAPSYTGKALDEVVLYMRIYSVTILFSLLTSMLSNILNAERVYGYEALASIIYSLTSIICMILLNKVIGIVALAISVPLSFLIQLIVLLIVTRKYVVLKPHIDFGNQDLKNIVLLMIPVLLSNTTVELNQLITRTVATRTSEGAVSILTYTNTLFNFVSSFVVASFITVYYTELSSANAEKDDAGFSRIIKQATTILYLALLPVSIISIIYSKDIVRIVYGRGAFSDSAVALTAKCLSIYAVAFGFDGIRNLLIRAFYARGNTKTPLINSIISLSITSILSLILSRVFGVTGIIISIVVSIICTSILMLVFTRSKIAKIPIKEFIPTVLKSIVSASITAVLLVLLDNVLQGYSPYIRFVIAVVCGFAIYASILLLLKCKELKDVVRVLKKRRTYNTEHE